MVARLRLLFFNGWFPVFVVDFLIFNCPTSFNVVTPTVWACFDAVLRVFNAVFTTSVANLYRSKAERPPPTSATAGISFLLVVFAAAVREAVDLMLDLLGEGNKRPFRREWVVEVQDSIDAIACRMTSNRDAVGAAESITGLKVVVAITVGNQCYNKGQWLERMRVKN